MCREQAWPLRDLRAAAAFAGRPVDNPYGYVPEIPSIRLSEVIRNIGRRWIEVEQVRQQTLHPIYMTVNTLKKECKIGVLDIAKMEKACFEIARGNITHPDPLTQMYIDTIMENWSEW